MIKSVLLSILFLSASALKDEAKLKPEEIKAIFQKLKKIGDDELAREKAELEKQKADHTANDNDLAFLASLSS